MFEFLLFLFCFVFCACSFLYVVQQKLSLWVKYIYDILIFNDKFAREKKIKGFEGLTNLELVGQESSYSNCTKGKVTKITKFFMYISNHILILDSWLFNLIMQILKLCLVHHAKKDVQKDWSYFQIQMVIQKAHIFISYVNTHTQLHTQTYTCTI